MLKKSYKTILVAGILAQVILFIWFLLQNRIYCDEVMTILNARSIADSGTDILGNSYPIYFGTWLYGGQSPIATYIMALFIKCFGYSLFISRLPILIASVAGFIFFILFLKELELDESKIICIAAFAAVSPWRLMSSVWTLDCEFIVHLFIIGMFFIVKAVKTDRLSYYITAMIFFAACIYCYILALVIIPIFLFSFFIMLLAKKKTRLSRAVISAVIFTALVLPFAAYMLVQLDILCNFSIGKISFYKMEYYSRQDDMLLSGGGLKEKIIQIMRHFFHRALMLFVPDFVDTLLKNKYPKFVASFGWGHLLFGICVFGFLVSSAVNIIKKRQSGGNTVTNSYIAASALSFAIMVLLVPNGGISENYRFDVFSYALFVMAGLFLARLLYGSKTPSAIKQYSFKIIAVLMLLSVALTSYIVLSFDYGINAYSKDFTQCIEYAESNSQSICIINSQKEAGVRDRYTNGEQAVYLQLHYYDEREGLIPLKVDLINRGIASEFNSNPQTQLDIKSDSSVRYVDSIGNDNCYIVDKHTFDISKINSDGFEIHEFGSYIVLLKIS